RIEWVWKRVLESPDTKVFGYLAERKGHAEGYVVYIQKAEQPFGYELHLRDLVALTPEATRRLLTLLGDHRSVSRSTLYLGGPADPVLLHLAEQEWKIDLRWD